jgi:hypothetical protein
VWYEVKVLENLEVRVEKDNTTFDIRIGWSTDDSGMMLGKLRVMCIVADPDPGSGAFLTLDPDPGSGIGFFRIPDPNPIFFRA